MTKKPFNIRDKKNEVDLIRKHKTYEKTHFLLLRLSKYHAR